MNKSLSVVIPSYKDKYLNKTIESILVNSGLDNDIEIIAVLDGYWTHDVINDKRVRYVHLGKNRGMRGAINAGVSVANGKYLMRTDEHCCFGENFAKIILSTIQDNWIVTARRYFLNPVDWVVMDEPCVDFEKLVIQDNIKFSGQRWNSRSKELADVPIAETMAMQGSFWIMPHAWWDKVIVKLQIEGYGPLYQDSHEMVFKTWKAGGKLVLNKETWYAHKHRSYPRTHNNGTTENPSNNDACWKYSLDTWREYYEKEILPKWNLQSSITQATENAQT